MNVLGRVENGRRMIAEFQQRCLCLLVVVGVNEEASEMQHELQSSGAEWAYKNVYAKSLMKGSKYNYHPEFLNRFCAIKTLQSEFCSTY